ncbi:hypothetical protein Pyrfu_0591 [Pyrolobus fumarii 1A]|uniref:Uncharacterized protein n=1 Tax=Pyrolobus fumarii (strain DSM 11204 / 1A) TaxID=694429 RepID=G0EH11_PYRF1|nr:hypothetical protein [Pyrolobus fumarii]AEM38461.1 hypothetical protein Pyrfu_0591 [Pyrolobus fumarii 1A]
MAAEILMQAKHGYDNNYYDEKSVHDTGLSCMQMRHATSRLLQAMYVSIVIF